MPDAAIDGSPASPADQHEPEVIAARAGLVHRPDDRPGIIRRRAGRGFTYRDADGRRLQGDERRRIEALAIPPAWTDVWISPEPDSHLLASGTDDAGRKQYLYHPAWIQMANEVKFERLAGFARPLATLRAHVAEVLASPTDEDWVCATVVRLIDETLIRPGSFRRFHLYGSVGATTLHPEHVTLSRRVLRLNFEGKGAVEHDVEVRDPLLARRVSDLLDRAAAGPLFTDEAGACVDATRLNRFIAEHSGGGFSAKDLRTWGATCLVAEELVTGAEPATPVDDQVREAIQATAERLGNTAAVCRSSYIAPAVLDAHVDGRLVDAWRRSRRATWLSRSEQTVRRVLEEARSGNR